MVAFKSLTRGGGGAAGETLLTRSCNNLPFFHLKLLHLLSTVPLLLNSKPTTQVVHPYHVYFLINFLKSSPNYRMEKHFSQNENRIL